jgi:hypothetical protein
VSLSNEPKARCYLCNTISCPKRVVFIGHNVYHLDSDFDVQVDTIPLEQANGYQNIVGF